MGDAKRRKDEIAVLKRQSEILNKASDDARLFAEIFANLRRQADQSSVKVVDVKNIGGRPLGKCIDNAWDAIKDYPSGKVSPVFGWVVTKNLLSSDIEIMPHMFNVYGESSQYFDTTTMPMTTLYSKFFYIVDYGMFRFVCDYQSTELESDLPRHLFARNNAVFSVLNHSSETGIPTQVRNMSSFGIKDFDWYWNDQRELERAKNSALNISAQQYRALMRLHCASNSANDDRFFKVA